jgi:aspartate aminotransferase-like enzyme
MLQENLLLRIPGPTPIPPSVEQAMTKPMIGHRGQETKALLERIKPKLRPVFGTKQDVMVVAASGTGGLEAAVVNTMQAGDEVLVIVTGAFGDRFAKICGAYNLHVHRMEVAWGEAADAEQVKAFLQENKQVKAVFATYCETSTGILNPVADISRTVRENSDALVIVDGVSCVGGVATEMDDWGVDVFVTGSQKAMMLPPGLTFIAVSERGWERIEANKQPRFYFDLLTYRKNLEQDSTPFTPAVSLLFGLEKALDLLEQEGLQNVYKRHELMMRMTREAFKALDIPLLTTDENASPTVTAIKPDHFDGEQLRKQVKKEFNLELAGGQQHLKGKIVRVGHMGYCSPADALQTISLIETGLAGIGRKTDLGKGTAAAQAIFVQEEVK